MGLVRFSPLPSQDSRIQYIFKFSLRVFIYLFFESYAFSSSSIDEKKQDKKNLTRTNTSRFNSKSRSHLFSRAEVEWK
jgi:hypothetical protein